MCVCVCVCVCVCAVNRDIFIHILMLILKSKLGMKSVDASAIHIGKHRNKTTSTNMLIKILS